MNQSAMPVLSCVLVPDMLPAPPPELVLPARLPADLPYAGRAALAGTVPGGQRDRGELVRAAGQACRNEGECARLLRFMDAVDDTCGRRGREYPLRYLLALPLAAGMAGDGELDAAGEWIASAPEAVLLRLGAPRDRSGRARRPDATTIGRILGDVGQCQYDDALCARAAARARVQRPGLRKHLRIDGKAVRGARRGGHAPMLLSGIWDDGTTTTTTTTAAQLPVNTAKTSEIPVFRELLKKIPDADLEGAVITACQMHTQRKHARLIAGKGGYFIFTIGGNQPKLFDAADDLCWKSVAAGAWTVDRGHGRTDVRVIKAMPATERIRELFPHVRQVFLVERYTYCPDGELLGAVAVLGITSLAPDQAGPADLLAYLRGHWAIEMHHYVRDVTFGDDASRVSRAHQAMATIRNTIIGILHLHRIPNIVAQLRICHRDPYRLPSRSSSPASPGPRRH